VLLLLLLVLLLHPVDPELLQLQCQQGAGSSPPAVAVQPGTAALLDQVVTAKEAAHEKMEAGENRAVEHVALADEETDALVVAGNVKRKGLRGQGGEKKEIVGEKRQRRKGKRLQSPV
jgi:hypothetical protein